MKILKAVSIVIFISLLAIGCGSSGSDSENKMGNVEGIVTDASTGALLSGVTVSIADKSDTTGSNGIYSINNLDGGNLPVSAALSGYHTYLGTCNVVSNATTSHNIKMSIVQDCNSRGSICPTDPDAGQCAVDFSRDTSNFAMVVAANSNFPSIAGNNLTVEAWVRPGAHTSSAAQGIFSRFGDAGALLYVQGGIPKFALRQVTPSPPAASTSTDYTVNGTTTMLKDIWYHIAGVVVDEDHGDSVGIDDHPTITCLKGDGTAGGESETPHLDIYVNGSLEACATTWDAVNFIEPQGVADPGSFGGSKDVNIAYIGSLPGFFTPYVDGNADIYFSQFHGTIDEVRLWTVARSAADITACKDAELTSSGACVLNPNILKGYWKMNECEGNYVNDWSGGGSIGRIEKGISPWVDGWVDGAFK